MEFAAPSSRLPENIIWTDDRLRKRKQLAAAHRHLSFVTLSIINDIGVRVFVTLSVIVSALILRGSSITILSQLHTELWAHNVHLIIISYLSVDIVLAWILIVYLRYLGVDWISLWKLYLTGVRLLMIKVGNVMLCVFWFSLGIVRRD